MNHGSAAIFPAIVREDVFNLHALRFVKWQHPVLNDNYDRFGKLRGIGFSEPKGTVCIHDYFKVDVPDAFDGTHIELIL